jgi:hypothetical protein
MPVSLVLVEQIMSDLTYWTACYECAINVCERCFVVGRGCKDRRHVLAHIEPESDDPFLECNRGLNPMQGLICDRRDCREKLEGLYFRRSIYLDDWRKLMVYRLLQVRRR